MKTQSNRLRDMSNGKFAAIRIALALSILVAALFIPGCQQSAASAIDFGDQALSATIRDAIGKPTGDIHVTDLIELTSLIADNRRIVDLEGIQHCVNLTELFLHNNKIIDITPLSDLTNLTELWLHDNMIVDISSLSDLINLMSLRLSGNRIVNLSALSSLVNLRELSLDSNEIVDISDLSRLSNLTELLIYSNEIIDISSLSKLTKLSQLHLSFNKISNLSPLVNNLGIGAGDRVVLSFNYLDLTPASPDMLDLSTLQDREVDVSYAPQHPDLPTTVVVNFPDPGLEAAIRGAVGRVTGDILDSDLLGLIHLFADNQSIANLEGIQHCADLKSLILFNNQIVDIIPLSELVNLTSLILDNNQIVDIISLSGLINLRTLSLNDNQIVDISALSSLISLRTLSLQSNKIAEIQALASNFGLSVQDWVDIRSNHLDLAPGSLSRLTIGILQDRGVDVEFDPQD